MEDYTAEMIKDMAFSFCPQCGAAIVPNHRGRPRKFCSPECRSKWNNTHPRPQNWKTVRSKVCPMCGREFSYAVAKQYGFWMVKEYRDAYGMFAVNGILFNHESERRGENFVTRKITLAAGRIAEGLQDHLELGNMDSLRDWGYAKDYVECMWLIMQQDKPEDFVIATGVQHTVRDFTEKAFAANGITICWEGTGIDEKG